MLAGQDFTMGMLLDGPLGEGVLAELGDWNSGFAFVVRNGTLSFLLNLAGSDFEIDAPMPPAPELVELRFVADGADGGVATLHADGQELGRGVIDHMFPFVWSVSGCFLRVGRGDGFPVVDLYENPSPYTGRIRTFTLETGNAAGIDLDRARRQLERSD